MKTIRSSVILCSAIFLAVFSTPAFAAVSPSELARADSLADAGDYSGELEYLLTLRKNNPDEPEILWRIAQARFDIADQTDDVQVHREQYYPGFEAAKQAVELNPNSARANHWYAVLIGKIGMLEGTEQKIINSYEVEKYAMRAIQLDPSYDGTYHVMGRWHYELADLNWFERKIAGWVYETPPEGSFSQAAVFFRKAIDAKPDEIRHHVWLGKTYIELDDNKAAKRALKNALSLKPEDDGDRLLQKEARELLNDM